MYNAYDTPSGVGIVVRDKDSEIATGLYNICYLNGGQIQDYELNWWQDHCPECLLRDGDGDLVEDPEWEGEFVLDIHNSSHREKIVGIQSKWIRECKDDGFDAVEMDNLDTFTRFSQIKKDNTVDWIKSLSDHAHSVGLAIAQKNTAELLERADEMGTDFAVVESCNKWDECQDFIDVYGKMVLAVEYRQKHFNKGCEDFGGKIPIIYRDHNLHDPSKDDYQFDSC